MTVFAHVPRTGGQAIRAALGLSMHELHLTTAELKRRGGPGTQVFTFVRDPWDRAVSIYAFLHRQREITPVGFRAWVADGMLHPCGRPPMLYEGTPYAVGVTAPQVEFARGADWVGRFEHLDREFTRLCQWLGVEPRPLPHLNGVARPDSLEFYDDETLNRIGECYKEDVGCFHYQTPSNASGG